MKSIFQKITVQKVVKGFRYLKHYGWKEFIIRLQEKMEAENVTDYTNMLETTMAPSIRIKALQGDSGEDRETEKAGRKMERCAKDQYRGAAF